MDKKQQPKLVIPKSKPFDKEAYIKSAKKVAKIFEKEGKLQKQHA
jgi:hypothetical protein